MHPDTPAGDDMARRVLAAWTAVAHPHGALYYRVRAVARVAAYGALGAAGAGAVWLTLWSVAILAGVFG